MNVQKIVSEMVIASQQTLISRLEQGGIVTNSTIAEIGESGNSEVILPLHGPCNSKPDKETTHLHNVEGISVTISINTSPLSQALRDAIKLIEEREKNKNDSEINKYGT